MVSSSDLRFDPRAMLAVPEGHQPVAAHLDEAFVVLSDALRRQDWWSKRP
jgi:hypothetical protein